MNEVVRGRKQWESLNGARGPSRGMRPRPSPRLVNNGRPDGRAHPPPAARRNLIALFTSEAGPSSPRIDRRRASVMPRPRLNHF